jgi:hypothetical protein
VKRPALLLVPILVAATALAFVPLLTCPDCGEIALDAAFAPGCPRCGDSGRISAFNRVSRRGLDPDLTRLVRAAWWDTDGDFEAALERLLDRASRRLSLGKGRTGHAVFADDQGEVRLMVKVRSTLLPPADNPVAVLLFDRDGTLRDLVEAWVDFRKGGLKSDFGRPGALGLVSEAGPGITVTIDGRETLHPVDQLVVRPAGGRLEVVTGR